ncbi:MAG: Druantia anti-phage system protein DruA, partial [Pseudomonadota bacterium]
MWLFGQWFGKETVARIKAAVEEECDISRRSLARRVCEWLGWRRADGTVREESCRKALDELKRREIIQLPEKPPNMAFARKGTEKRRGGGAKVEVKVKEVKCGLEEIEGLEVVAISSRYSKDWGVWKGLMQRYHYLGAGPLCGAQIRYLIISRSHGLLGGLSFSAASPRLKERDRWIGWS